MLEGMERNDLKPQLSEKARLGVIGYLLIVISVGVINN
jgi:hypothetical protein